METASTQKLRRHIGRKTKWVVAFAVVVVLLVSFFVFLPAETGSPLEKLFGITGGNTSGPLGLIGSAEAINSTVWLQVAANAWAYFQPGVGVDATTGLPYAGGTNFKGFTGWDLGVYIQSVIDAAKLGLISPEGPWGSDARIEKVLAFLETCPINTTTNYPFWFYDATTGTDYSSLSDKATQTVDVVDMGRLFVALNNLRIYNSSLTQQIDNYVLDGRSDFAALVPCIEADSTLNNIYGYYFASGYASFWPAQLSGVPNDILNSIESDKTVTTYNISLPNAAIDSEPLLCSIFELNNTAPALSSLMSQVYLAHVAYYDATGKFAATSEGNGFASRFVYEWVVAPDGTPWEITGTNSQIITPNPIIFTKVAFGFLALYNSTYARDTLVYLEKTLPAPTHGYDEGADNNGNVVPSFSSNTNGLILDAALYAIQHNP